MRNKQNMQHRKDMLNKIQLNVEVKGLEEIVELITEIKQFKNEVKGLIKGNKKKTYSIKETAEELRVSVGTVNNKIKAGKLKSIQDAPKGVRLISTEELERYIREEENRFR